MKPIRIEFQAFGPYADHEEIDFRAISAKGLFLICGKTGIGKTMILDAMTFALFGKSSGHGRDDFEAMRCTNAPFDKNTYVRFEFENNNEYFRFERRLERKRKKLSAAYDVSKKDEEGIWRTLLENAKDKEVSAKAEEIIGLKYEQFRQVIVLPQGQFERLLTSNSDEKELILSSIFGEAKWQRFAEIFYDNAEKRRNELKGIQERIRNSLNDEKCETISELNLKLDNNINQYNKLEEDYKKTNYDSIIKEQQENLFISKRFGDLHKAEDKKTDLKEKKEERKLWEQELQIAKRANNVKIIMDTLDLANDDMHKRMIEEEKARKNVELKKNDFEIISKELEDHIKNEDEIEVLINDKIKYEGKRDDYIEIDDVKNRLIRMKKRIDQVNQAEIRAKRKYDSYVDIIKDIQIQYKRYYAEHSELLNTYLTGIVGEIAKDLIDGKPCPVCGSKNHPNKAKLIENSVTKEKVDFKKKSMDQKYNELQDKINEQDDAKKDYDIIHANYEKCKTEYISLKSKFDSLKKNMVKDISNLDQLENEITRLQRTIVNYENKTNKLNNTLTEKNDAFTEAKTQLAAAKNETQKAKELYDITYNHFLNSIEENGFSSEEEVKKSIRTSEQIEELSNKIAEYDADLKLVTNNIREIKKELKDKVEPDEENCQKKISEANDAISEYKSNRAVLRKEIDRLDEKLTNLKSEGKGIEERIREAEEDFAFAKKLRGDSGTGFQRYVLGIMFSSVISAANKMLEKVHGGRYRLYRSDEKVQGTNKRGLELKVFDNYSEEHDGRFVGTLSGGEKFLTSLALSIGMSTVAQKSGIRIDALFIDEGFGSLDEDSIGDAMNVLNSIQEANGLVGIISHVQILQDQIPSKLIVKKTPNGSHIETSVG